MKDFFQIFKILDNSVKYKFLIFIFFIILNSLLEIISISALLPVIELVSQNKISDINKFNNLFFEKINLGNNPLVALSLIALAVIILKNLIFILINFWQISFINKVEFSISKKLISNYFSKDYNFFLKKNSSELIRNFTTETNNIVKGLGNFFSIVVEILLLIILVIYLVLINPKITIILFLILSLIVLILNFLTSSQIKRWSYIRADLTAGYLKILIQTFNSIKEIFVFKKTEEIEELHNKKKKELIDVNKKFSYINTIPKPFAETLVFSILIFLIIKFYQSENFFSYFTLYALVLLRLYPSVNKIVLNLQAFRYKLVSFGIIRREFYEVKDEKNKNFIHLDKNFFKSKINVENLSFKYGDKNIINDMSFELNVGKTYGIFGASGSGKSTFLDLIMGLKSPSLGRIKFDNKEVNNKKYNWLSVIGYVPQNPYLYDETILRNICFGLKNSEINLEKVKDALKKSNLETFIKTLPDGLNTLIGERGVRISGGQMQRISLARALYHDPKVLILDEVTNQLDDETENQIIEDLLTLKKDKLILFVTHKKNLLRNFDETIEFKNKKFL
jgi:ATP-binding cassette, subfamily B, bacterial PglK